MSANRINDKDPHSNDSTRNSTGPDRVSGSLNGHTVEDPARGRTPVRTADPRVHPDVHSPTSSPRSSQSNNRRYQPYPSKPPSVRFSKDASGEDPRPRNTQGKAESTSEEPASARNGSHTPTVDGQLNSPLDVASPDGLATLKKFLDCFNSGIKYEPGPSQTGLRGAQGSLVTAADQELDSATSDAIGRGLMRVDSEGNLVIIQSIPEYRKRAYPPIRLFLEDCLKRPCEQEVATFNNLGISTMHEIDLVIEHKLENQLFNVLAQHHVPWVSVMCIQSGLKQIKDARRAARG
ncbi:hypothetical protein BDW22DRAFT_1350427 [Trametopsis cervina]|nr:hypothetical protein BDW22DRAFT_1350427 [Trametopsis cervina]